MARKALHSVPILSLEEVYDKAVIAHAVDLPLLFAPRLFQQRLELDSPFRRELLFALCRKQQLELSHGPSRMLRNSCENDAIALRR